MPSSTSSSNRRSANKAIAAFFAIAVLLAAATELCTRYIIDPGSAIQRRVEGERAEAVALRPEEAG